MHRRHSGWAIVLFLMYIENISMCVINFVFALYSKSVSVAFCIYDIVGGEWDHSSSVGLGAGLVGGWTDAARDSGRGCLLAWIWGGRAAQ